MALQKNTREQLTPVQSPEQVTQPELQQERAGDFRVEQVQQQEQAPQPQEISEAPTAVPVQQHEQAPALPPKPAEILATEEILSDGLGEFYANMDPQTQQSFKLKGEEITVSIKQMADQGKLKAKKVLHLVRDWLKMIPGVNKFFLEQEAKIKTESVMDYYKTNDSDMNAL